MVYLLGKIFLCLLFAFLLGLALAWWIWGSRLRRLSDQLDTVERERDAIRRDHLLLQELHSHCEDHDGDFVHEEITRMRDMPELPSMTRPSAPGPASSDRPVVLLASPTNGPPDQLKHILGVGPALEKTLNGLGIYYFHQIAQFTEQDIGWVDARLGDFQGRIVRDDWVGQATALAKKKGDL